MPPSATPIPPASELIGRMADWLEAQEDLSLAALTAGPLSNALTGEQLEHIADDPAERDVLVIGLRQSVLAARVLEAEREVEVLRVQLSGAYGLIRDCQSHDGWSGGMDPDVRDRVDEFVEALDLCQEPVSREREAFEALLSLVVEKASLAAPGFYRTGSLSSEHRMWAIFGEWRAGGESQYEAREALKDVIRAALIEQTGGER
jgi:hypothetical protein